VPGRVSPAALPAGLTAALALCAALAAGGCNSALFHGLALAIEESPDPRPWSYAPSAAEPAQSPTDVTEPEVAARLARFAPVFEIEGGEADWNRIGTPTLRRRAGHDRARVDTARATLYAEERAETVGARSVHQLVYRVHFDAFEPTLATVASMHRNAGLLVLVSVDAESEVPLCVSTVHTCGCWLALSPTEALASEALPDDWPDETVEVHGEELPARIAVPRAGERFLVRLRSGTHRVHDVAVGPAPDGALALELRPMAELRALPVEGAPGATASFFYERGYLEGYVKGAWAPLEGLTLGLLTLDPRLGMDRDFGDPEETGARFFTALAPWKREATRLDRFGRALEELGFHPQAFAPAGAP
jgi:hypothetical protein